MSRPSGRASATSRKFVTPPSIDGGIPRPSPFPVAGEGRKPPPCLRSAMRTPSPTRAGVVDPLLLSPQMVRRTDSYLGVGLVG